jgi:hypothetical protein
MKSSKLLPEKENKARVQIERSGAAWSVIARVEPFATLLEASEKNSTVRLPFTDTFVHRLLLRMERDGLATRES